MKRIISVILMGTFAVSLLTACQPTPEVSPLQSKGQLQEKIEESEEVKVYEETEPKLQFTEEFEGGNTYEINAVVNGQDVETIPIYDIEFIEFEDGDAIKERVEAAFPDYVLGADFYTKEYYTKQLALYQQYLARFESGLHPVTGEPLVAGEEEKCIWDIPIAEEYEYMRMCDPVTGESLGNPPVADNLKALLKETTAKIEKAPSVDEIGMNLDFEDIDGAEVVRVLATNENETLDLSFSNDWSGSVFWLDNMTLREMHKESNDDGYVSFSSPTANPEEFADNRMFLEAKAYADAMVKNLGAEDLVLTEISQNSEGDSFKFLYTKNVNAGNLRQIIPGDYYSTLLDTDIQGYIDIKASETFDFQFHNGILYQARWFNPSRFVKKVENATVLPWEEILTIAKQQLKYIVVPEEGKEAFGYNDYSDIVVENIELGYTKMLVKDTKDQYQMIPTWNFMGYCSANPSKKNICFLTVNAIDGTIMEHRLGY